MIVWLIALVALSAALTWGLGREFQRLEREAAYRRWLATSPQFAALTRQFEAFKVAIGVALLPAMQQMAQALHDALPTLERFADAMRNEETK